MENNQQSFWQFSDQLRVQASNLANLSLNDSIWSNNYGSKRPDERRNFDIRVGGQVNVNPFTKGSDLNAFDDGYKSMSSNYNDIGLGPIGQIMAPASASQKNVGINGGFNKGIYSKPGHFGLSTNNNNNINSYMNVNLKGNRNKEENDHHGLGSKIGKKNSNKKNNNKDGDNNSDNKDTKTAADKRFKTLPPSEALPRNETIGGYIFVCNNDTMAENLKRQLFGLPPRYRDSVRAITPGLPLFLYNYSTHQLPKSLSLRLFKLPRSTASAAFARPWIYVPRSPSSNLSCIVSSKTALPSTILYLTVPRANMATKSSAAASHDEYNRNSLFNLKGRVALVTGGGSGIGLMVTQALAVNGAKVYIVGRTAEKLQNVVDKYGKDIESEIIPITADVTRKEDIAKLVKEIESREKCLCILVNNAGLSSTPQSTESESAQEMKKNLFDNEKATIEDWTNTYAANVASIFFATTAFLPLLQASTEHHSGWSGTVINISSISGMVKSAQHHFSYNASKAASIHLTRMLAAEIAESGHKIRVNSIAPGPFPSEMTTKESDEFQKSEIPKEKYASKYPAGRPGRDIDMAQAVLMLAANQFVNGQTLAVDGGYTLAAGL